MNEIQHGQLFTLRLLAVDGDDKRIAQRARLSYDRDDDKDYERLVRYLVECWHSGPIEFCSMQFELTAPLAIVAQLLRHRTFSFNQMSMRYVPPPETAYIPEVYRVPGGSSKQGSEVDEGKEDAWHEEQWDACATAIDYCNAVYHQLVEAGVAPEQARMVIPQAQHTRIAFKADLHNLLHYLRLRLHPHAQLEHRLIAEAIAVHVEEHFPVVWQAFKDFRLDSRTFSAEEVGIMRAAIADLDAMVGGFQEAAVQTLGSESKYKRFIEKLGMEAGR